MWVLDWLLKVLNPVSFKDTPTTIDSGWKSEKTVLDKIIDVEKNNSGRKEKTHRS